MIKLHIFVDASSIEVFADDGATVLTERIFPDPGSVDVHAFAHGGKAKLNGLAAQGQKRNHRGTPHINANQVRGDPMHNPAPSKSRGRA